MGKRGRPKGKVDSKYIIRLKNKEYFIIGPVLPDIIEMSLKEHSDSEDSVSVFIIDLVVRIEGKGVTHRLRFSSRIQRDKAFRHIKTLIGEWYTREYDSSYILREGGID